MSRPLDIEQRAAEIVAAMENDYPTGGWFACMTRDEQRGWNMHEAEWFAAESVDPNYFGTPRNRREWAGYIAREIIYPFNVVPECATSMGCLCAGHASGLDGTLPCTTTEMPDEMESHAGHGGSCGLVACTAQHEIDTGRTMT